MALPKFLETDFLYSKHDHKRVKNLITVQLAFMAVVGQVPYILRKYVPCSVRSIGCILTRLYSVFVILLTLHTCILFLKMTFDMLQRGELNEITDSLSQAIISAFSCFSTCYWLWHSKALRKFIEFINLNYWHHSLPGLTFVSFFEVYKKSQRITLCWIFSAVCGVVLWGLAPLLQGSHTLPLKCWYPFDPLQPYVYTIVYSIQMVTQINIGVTFSCGSALYVSLIVLVLGQFDVLFCSLKNIEFHAQLIAGENIGTLRNFQANLPLPLDDEINQYQFSKEQHTNLALFEKKFDKRNFKIALRNSIIKCVKLHRFIWECCSIIESLYHPYCLLKSIQITVQLCLLVFVGVAGEKSLMRIFNLFQYATLTLIELVMFTFYGELLRQHSTRSGDAIFRSNWFVYSPLVRKDLLIFLVNSKRAVKLTAGKFFVMDLERLRSVITQAFSFLTLLQKLDAKNNKQQ